jgi:hypothetical protein
MAGINLKGIHKLKPKGGLTSLMFGLHIACYKSVIRNLDIMGNFADMSQHSA